MNRPSYVTHDDKRWLVLGDTTIDGEPAYELRGSRGPGRPPCHLVARVVECNPWQRPLETLRLYRAGGFVLEIRSRGSQVREMKVRADRSRQRWETSVPAIFRLTVAAHVAKNRKPRRRRGF